MKYGSAKNKNPYDHYDTRAGIRINLNSCWEEVLPLATRYEAAKGDFIHFTGEMEKDFYYLAEGCICLQVITCDGKENTTSHFYNGCLFNIVSPFVHEDEENSLWLVLEHAVFYRFPGALLHSPEFISKYPHLIINLLHSFSVSVTIFHAQLSRMAVSSALCLVCQHIIGLAEAAKSFDFAPKVTQEEVARQLGIHRGTLCSIIKYLKHQGIIRSFCKNRLTILDFDKLSKLSQL